MDTYDGKKKLNDMGMDEEELTAIANQKHRKIIDEEYNKSRWFYDSFTDPSKTWDPLFEQRDGVADYEKIKEQMRKKSVGKYQKSAKAKKKKNELIRKKIVSVALATVIVLTAGAAIKKGSDWKERNDRIQAGITAITGCARENLLNAGLAIIDDNGNFVVTDNSPMDYQEKLGLNHNIDSKVVRGYYEAINDVNELEDFIKGIPCSEDDVICCTGLNGPGSYLSQFGFYDPKTGQPSIEVFKNLTDADILSYMNINGINGLKALYSYEIGEKGQGGRN